MKRRWSRWLVLSLLPLVFAPMPAMADGPEGPDPVYAPELFSALAYRNIGPYRGGRSTAVAGVVGDRDTYYMGTTGGGVWKTTDGGVRWSNVSDKHFKTASVGAVAVAPSDANVVYAGMGSACPRGNVSPGDGVYRSTDAGKTWNHAGLPEAGQIGRIHVHPNDPDTVYVAALGHIFGPNEERGVFRSKDGGETWEKVLYVSDRAGAVDLAMSAKNPRILFAAIWEAERKPWTLESGGEDSGLWRSADGGDTWEEVTKGLPEGTKGRIGVAVSAANPNRVWALVEADKGGLFRSDNGGDSFRLINADRNFRQRAWYYTHVYADPQDAETVYVLNTGLYRSHDAGKEFEFIRVPHGDNHDLWINPDDPRVMINANDGGSNVSYNGGRSWSTQTNQPTAEMYRVSVDDQFPYRVYGCQQDNSCVSLPSRTTSGGIARHHWWVIGGCESGHVAIDPRDPDVTYAGCYGGQISRHDNSTGQDREINIYPQVAVGQKAEDLEYRFQWNAPIRLSPHDPSVLYHTSQFVHRSTDEGQSWETISPDLTRNDVTKQGYAGGSLTWDNTGVEVYGTVFAFEESPHEAGVLWAGTDDGKVHVSRDNGANWQDVTPRKMPEWGTVNTIELSAHGAGRAFLAVHRYRQDDFAPYVFRTDDYGASWKRLTDGKNGIPADHSVRVVREDPDVKGLLYAGGEFGLYVSFDDGKTWQSFQQKLPVTPITDLQVKNQDLVVATQGRSFWILDDLTPLHQLDDEVAAADAWLFDPRDTYRLGGGGFGGRGGSAGANPPGGVMIFYYLAEEPESSEDPTEVQLEIMDAGGEVLRTLSSTKPEYRAPSAFARFFPELFAGGRKLEAKKGMNRYVWNFRLPDGELQKDAVLWGSSRGPRVPPGTYQAKLSIGEWSQTREFEILADPRLDTPQADYDAQFALAKKVWETLVESHAALGKLRDTRTQIGDLTKRLTGAGHGEGLEDAAKAAKEKLTAIEERIYQTKTESSQDVLNFPPKIDGQIAGLLGAVESADARPTAGVEARFTDLRAELDAILADLDAVMATEVAEFNRLVKEKDAPAVIVPGD